MKRSRRQVLGDSAALFAALSTRTQTGQAQDAQTPPETRARLRELIGGYRITQMVHVAAKLRIADHLKSGPLTVKELARLTSTHEDSLYRLLRTLAGLGVFSEEDGPSFRLTPMADLLRSDVSGSLRVSAEVTGEPWVWRPWGDLMHSIKTGEVAFDNLYGKDTWDWFAENPGPASCSTASWTSSPVPKQGPCSPDTILVVRRPSSISAAGAASCLRLYSV